MPCCEPPMPTPACLPTAQPPHLAHPVRASSPAGLPTWLCLPCRLGQPPAVRPRLLCRHEAAVLPRVPEGNAPEPARPARLQALPCRRLLPQHQDHKPNPLPRRHLQPQPGLCCRNRVRQVPHQREQGGVPEGSLHRSHTVCQEAGGSSLATFAVNPRHATQANRSKRCPPAAAELHRQGRAGGVPPVQLRPVDRAPHWPEAVLVDPLCSATCRTSRQALSSVAAKA